MNWLKRNPGKTILYVYLIGMAIICGLRLGSAR